MFAALIAPISILLIAALVAAPSIWLAGRRGRSQVIWGALGLLLPLVSILLLVVLGQKKEAAAA
jgi:hypothetical protein